MGDAHDLLHHGDVEARGARLDLAVNVYDAPPPTWLRAALRDSLDDLGRYPDPTAARAAAAAHHGRPDAEVLVTAGAAEAFTLLAALPWRCAVVMHPQFTEPHAALERAGHRVHAVVLAPPFTLSGVDVPEEADLVVVGNPTNPTGVLHDRASLLALLRPGRTVVVDEAFMDCLPGEPSSLAGERLPGLVVLRSLTKHWGIPGVRAGYLLGAADTVARLAAAQTPWSVATTAAAAVRACTSAAAVVEGRRRAVEIQRRRERLEAGLRDLGIPHIASRASFVLARPGRGVHAALRAGGVAVRRADTFPGLDDTWIRIAVRDRATTDALLTALRPLVEDPPPPLVEEARQRRHETPVPPPLVEEARQRRHETPVPPPLVEEARQRRHETPVPGAGTLPAPPHPIPSQGE